MPCPSLRLAFCAALLIGSAATEAAAQGAFYVETSGEYSPVTIAADEIHWHTARLAAGWFHEGVSGWSAGAERHQRGALVDWAATASGFRRNGDWTISGSAGLAADPAFLYRYSLEAEVARRIVGTIVLHGGYRHLSFPTADVRLLQPAASYYFPRGELQARAFIVRNRTLDRHSSAWLVRGTVSVHRRVTLGAGAAIGTRIFDVAALSEPDAEGWVGFGYARLALSRAWALDLGAGRAHEDPFFSQRTVSLGVRRTLP